MYGRREVGRNRLAKQSWATLMLVSGVTIRVTLSVTAAPVWALVIVEYVSAGLASLYPDRLGIRPSGPLFCIFALGACASIPTAVSAVVSTAASGAFVIFLCAGSAGFAPLMDRAGFR